ncbi:hypothetical protein D3C81_1298230 [compost metagenome]
MFRQPTCCSAIMRQSYPCLSQSSKNASLQLFLYSHRICLVQTRQGHCHLDSCLTDLAHNLPDLLNRRSDYLFRKNMLTRTGSLHHNFPVHGRRRINNNRINIFTLQKFIKFLNIGHSIFGSHSLPPVRILIPDSSQLTARVIQSLLGIFFCMYMPIANLTNPNHRLTLLYNFTTRFQTNTENNRNTCIITSI